MYDLPLFRILLGYGENYTTRFLLESGSRPLTNASELEHASLAYVFSDHVKRTRFSKRRLIDRPLPQFALSNGPMTINLECNRFTGDMKNPGKTYLIRGTFDLYDLTTGFLKRTTNKTHGFVVEDNHSFVIDDPSDVTKWFAHDMNERPYERRTIN